MAKLADGIAGNGVAGGGGLILPTGADGAADPTAPPPPSRWHEVPWRTIVAAIGLVVAALVLLAVVYLASRVVLWVVIAGFFAVVLARPVSWLEERCHLRRGVAIGIVVGLTLAAVAGLGVVFVLPVRSQLIGVLSDLEGTVQQAVSGQGPAGHLVTRLHAEKLVARHQDWLLARAAAAQASLPGMAAQAARSLVTVLTIAVMTCIMLGQSAGMGRSAAKLMPIRHRAWVSATMADAGRAVSSYMIANLLISLCAGVAALGFALLAGVPAAVVLALFVAVADLVPLVGATVGAAVVVVASALVSPGTAVAAVIFFALYQQFENFVLSPVVMARTVRINPLVTLLSVLLGVELFGFDGALLSVPLAGALTVIAKELWSHRPTAPDELVVVGASHTPAHATAGQNGAMVED